MFEDNKYTILERIQINKLVNLYKQSFDIDVSHLFPNKEYVLYKEHEPSGIKYFDPAIPADSSFYEHMQKFDWYYQKNKAEYSSVSKYTHNKKILEIGCGYAYFYDHSNAGEYTGLEFNQKAIDVVSQKKIKGVNLYKESMEVHAANNPSSYDVVCSFQVVEHVSDPIGFFESSLACCKKGGYLIVSVPAYDSFIAFAKNNILNMPPHHLTHWPDKAFKYLEEIFEVELVVLNHERLDVVHREWFLNVFGQNLLRRMFNFNNNKSLIAGSFFDKVLFKIASFVAVLLRKGFDEPVFMPAGHTVTAVYKKL